jgi:hypothetical protein
LRDGGLLLESEVIGRLRRSEIGRETVLSSAEEGLGRNELGMTMV